MDTDLTSGLIYNNIFISGTAPPQKLKNPKISLEKIGKEEVVMLQLR